MLDADTYTGADLDALKQLVRKAQRSSLARVQADLQQLGRRSKGTLTADTLVQAKLLDALDLICVHTGLRVLGVRVAGCSSAHVDLHVCLGAPTHTGVVQDFTLCYAHTRSLRSKARTVRVGSSVHVDVILQHNSTLADAGMQ